MLDYWRYGSFCEAAFGEPGCYQPDICWCWSTWLAQSLQHTWCCLCSRTIILHSTSRVCVCAMSVVYAWGAVTSWNKRKTRLPCCGDRGGLAFQTGPGELGRPAPVICGATRNSGEGLEPLYSNRALPPSLGKGPEPPLHSSPSFPCSSLWLCLSPPYLRAPDSLPFPF